MSYNIKTLIVFDTNSLRSTEAGEVAYSFFAFGRPFQIIEDFIADKDLNDDIHIAIPSWAIEELKDQKQRQYEKDIVEFQKLAKRLSGIPQIGEIALPETEFACALYIDEKATEYLTQKSIKLLEIKENIAYSVLNSMMVRVMKDEGKKAPFAYSGKYKDAGFKDNVLWESLMNFDEVSNYDKVIFVCKDGDFNRHCENEFIEKWQRHIAIRRDEANVLAELEKDYANYIQYRQYFDYTEKEYFQIYLQQQLNDKTYIQINGEDLKIENYNILNYCDRVEQHLNEESQEEEFIIHSKVNIAVSRNGDKEDIPIDVQVLMDDVFEIYETTFKPGLY